MEVRNRFKGLDLIDRVPDELWNEVRDIIQETGASLVAQTVKRLSAMQQTWVRSLGWEDPLEQGMATHSITLDYIVRRVTKSQTQLSDFTSLHFIQETVIKTIPKKKK